jgi:phosphoribosylformimino-5-aminoimidazole carboxamide ribonucleotide (ProFAR) isomerase
MEGPDLELLRDVAARSPHRLIASGGVGSIEDARAVAETGAAGLVVGMALYTGALDASAAAKELGSW